MLASIRGQVIDVSEQFIVLDVSGVGFQVYLPTPLLDRIKPGEPFFCYTYLVVREDLLSLYGFETKEEKKLFQLLISVNGVGPRLALAILSTLSPDVIRKAVYYENPEVFSHVPGIGRKTAQKIQLQLQDKLEAPIEYQKSDFSDVDADVLAALTTLGYSIVDAQLAIQTIPKETPNDVEIRLRIALQYFS
jgi:Holliday junction DNA helicase RuvA